MNYPELLAKLKTERDYHRSLVVCDLRLCQALDAAVEAVQTICWHLEPTEDDEPSHNDEVLCCPDCERPNQFGELCPTCTQEADLRAEDEGQRWADTRENNSPRCVW